MKSRATESLVRSERSRYGVESLEFIGEGRCFETGCGEMVVNAFREPLSPA